jgi:ferrochelatase
MSRTGVLLLGFGGPESIDSVRPFMCNLMDREPSDELVETVCRRYLAIGGGSPLPEIAQSIAEGLEERLGQKGKPAPVRVGMRYWHPFIADAVAELMELGCDRIVTYSLSPFESKAASGAYREAIEAVVAEHGHLEIVEAPLLSTNEEFADYFAGSTAVAIEDLEPNDGAIVVFTAHSLPLADLVDNDPYVLGLEDVAQQIAEKLGMARGHPDAGTSKLGGFSALGTTEHPRAWFLAYQSKGARQGGWLGPQLDDLIPAVAASNYNAIVVVPIGFTTDHMETLYDLDIVAAGAALDADVEFMRAKVPNDDPRILDAITEVVAPLI